MKIKKFGSIVFSLLLVLSMSYNIAFAQGTGSGGSAAICQLISGFTFAGLLDYISCILGSSVMGVIFALAIVYFMWGVVQYTLYPDEEAKKEKGKSMMIWGIIALTVMFSVYGLIRVTRSTFGLTEDSTAVTIPSLPSQ
ncbi:MAG: hypothetical protein M3Q34_01135 [bacterium]|nr:hypothetical protein [bacterium]